MEYINAAVEFNREEPGFKDTLGFLKIVFGGLPEEIEEGIELCDQVRKQGGPLEYYEKHLTIAIQRLKILRS